MSDPKSPEAATPAPESPHQPTKPESADSKKAKVISQAKRGDVIVRVLQDDKHTWKDTVPVDEKKTAADGKKS